MARFRLRNLLDRPAIAAGWQSVKQSVAKVLLGDNSNAPNPFTNPAAYSKLIAYAVTAASALAARWWGVDVSAELQGILVELLVSIVGGWAVWRIPNNSTATAEPAE